jgi:hypothetical protein
MRQHQVAYITNAGKPDNTALNTYHTIKPLQEIERDKYDRYHVDASVSLIDVTLERLWLENIVIPRIKNPSSTFGVTLERPMIDPHTYYLKAQKVFQLNHPTADMVKHCKDMEEPVTFPKGETLMEGMQRLFSEEYISLVNGVTGFDHSEGRGEIKSKIDNSEYRGDRKKPAHLSTAKNGPPDHWLQEKFGSLPHDALRMSHRGHFFELKRRERERDREIEVDVALERERLKIARSMYGISDEPAERSSDVLDAIRYSTAGRFTGTVAGEDIEKGDAVYSTPDLNEIEKEEMIKATRDMILRMSENGEVDLTDIRDLGKREAAIILRKMINGERT